MGAKMTTRSTFSSVILRESFAEASSCQWRGLEEKKEKPMLRLRSSLAELLSFSQRQETDGRAQLQKVLHLLWKTTHCVLQAETSAQCCSPARSCCVVPVDGWSLSPCYLWRCHFRDSQLPVMYGCLFPRSACCGRREMYQNLIMFLNLTLVMYAVGPVRVSLHLYHFQKHLIALSPCWIVHFRLDS